MIGVWWARGAPGAPGAQLPPGAWVPVQPPPRPPAETAVAGSPVAMGIVHMPVAFDDMAGVLVELTMGVPPVLIMLFGLWLNWLLF